VSRRSSETRCDKSTGAGEHALRANMYVFSYAPQAPKRQTPPTFITALLCLPTPAGLRVPFSFGIS
jgi:hypothetical protein